MPLKMKVLVGNITNLSDARYCAGMGVDMLGFPITKDQTGISDSTFLEIATWVSGPDFILEYQPLDQLELDNVTWLEAISHVRLSIKDLVSIPHTLAHKPLIVDTTLEEWSSESTRDFKVDSVVIHNPITEQSIERIKELNNNLPVFLPYENIKLHPEEIMQLPITGVVLQGSAEDKPGVKDYDLLSKVLEALEVD